MANIMQNFDLRNKPSRNGFDLGFMNKFTAKAGELLPIMCKEVLEGDKFKCSIDAFTRTTPVQTAAYVRMREYYDFVFVPYRLLYRHLPEILNDVDTSQSYDLSGIESPTNSEKIPYFSFDSAFAYLGLLSANSKLDLNSRSRRFQAAKLLSYLGYGRWYSNQSPTNVKLNPFPLLAYQKAYNDIFRNDQWEIEQPHTFNVDFAYPDSTYLTFPSVAEDIPDTDLFTLRYADYMKDMFMGVLPNTQMGESVVFPNLTNVSINNNTTADSTSLANNNVRVNASNKNLLVYDSNNSFILGSARWKLIPDNSSFTILALRQAETLQRYREILGTGKTDLRSRVQKLWNVDPGKVRSNLCEYIGGCEGNIDINGIDNTNLSDSSATIKGKGIGASRGSIEYDAKESGLMLCIYHVTPLLDYDDSGLDPVVTKTDKSDYANPVFDKIGMQPVYFRNLMFNNSPNMSNTQILGYAPRYIDYKTSVDRVHGGFNDANAFANWVAPLKLSDWINFRDVSSPDYTLFKVCPSFLDTIFETQVADSLASDQFIVNCQLNISAVRNLDYNGMPY